MKKLLILTAALMLLNTQLYAGNGDLIVNGNLGVGTSTPGSNVTISRDVAAVGGQLELRNTGGIADGQYDAIRFTQGADGETPLGSIRSMYKNTGNPDLAFFTRDYGSYNETEKMRVTSSGDVGIGTTSPSSKLELYGTGSQSLTITGDIASGGKVGVEMKRTGGTVNAGIYGQAQDSNDWGALVFYTRDASNYSERVRFSPSGNVGIGTPNPQRLLEVAGIARLNGVDYPSDIRFKKDIQSIDTPLTKLLSLNGVSYQWKTDEYKDKGFPEGRHYGVIAQEIEKVLPEVVNTTPDGTKSVAYTEIIPVLIEAMKAQQKEINELKVLVGQLTGK